MDLKQKGFAETPSRFHQLMDDSATNLTDAHLFPQFNFLHYIPGTSISEISPRLQSSSPLGPKVKKQGQSESSSSFETQNLTWDPTAMLNKLSFLEQKIHQVQDIILCMAKRDGQFSVQANELAAQQQLVTADLTSIIVQLIAAAGTLLPSTKNSITSFSNANTKLGISIPSETMSASDFDDLIKGLSECGPEGDELVKILKTPGAEMSEIDPMEDHDLKDTEDGADGDHFLPGSYQVLQLEKEEILAPHTHFCMICGKGFKRDANLRMHMRGHGDEYKSPAALAKPIKELNSEAVPIRRYSCPFMGCKRNKEHKKFLPLKTILCVKNHYKRSHCDKRYTCSRCNCKKFSVLADLKTHEKHCGRDKWLCSCGTTFSRKDKLFGHVALFQGHTPALPTDECKASSTYDHGIDNGGNDGGIDTVCKFGSSSGFDGANVPDTKGIEDDRGLFSLMNFDSYNFGGLDEFPRLAFGVSEDSFSLASSGSSSFMPRNGVN